MSENYQLQYLCTLILRKNEINRRRRRFMAALRELSRPVTRTIRDADWRVIKHVATKHLKVYTKAEATAGKNAAAAEMRALTKEMRQVRKAAGNLSLVWGASWNILGIHRPGYSKWDDMIKLAEIERLADLYQFDKIVLSA